MTCEHLLNHHITLAIEESLKSPDTTKVGAVLFDGAATLLTAHNGLAPGVEALPERLVRPEKYKWCVHAEQALIAKAARQGIITDKRTVLSTHIPCCSCADTLIFAGIKHVYYLTDVFGQGSAIDDGVNASRAKLKEAGVSLQCIGV